MGRRQPRLGRAFRIALWSLCVPITVGAVVYLHVSGQMSQDAHAYWVAWQSPLYDRPPGERDAFLYSPAFAQIIWPLTLLPWRAFAGVYFATLVAVTGWLLSPIGRRWWPPLLVLSVPLLSIGNVQPFIAAAIVLGVRWPAAWAFPILTKVATGVGLVWHVARREWRPLAVAGTSTLVVVAISAAINPDLWAEWLTFLMSTQSVLSIDVAPPLWVRFVAAAVLVGWGASTDRRWTVPVGVTLAAPMIGPTSLLILTAIPRLVMPAGVRAPASAERPVDAEAAAGGTALGGVARGRASALLGRAFDRMLRPGRLVLGALRSLAGPGMWVSPDRSARRRPHGALRHVSVRSTGRGDARESADRRSR